MVKRLDEDSRDILLYRPNITFIEPEVEPQPPEPLPPTPLQIEDIQQKRQEVKQLAKAVNALATTLQARADERAKGMAIKLDPKVDATAMQAMKRLYPEDDPTQITYDQYKQCKERMRQTGEDIGKQAIITTDDIIAARDQAASVAAINDQEVAASAFNQLGGWNTEEAKNGMLRPETNPKLQIVKPLDMAEFQDIVIKMLVNFMWKYYIRPQIPLPPGTPGLPERLVDVDQRFVDSLLLAGISVPGYKKTKEQEPPEVPTDVPEDM